MDAWGGRLGSVHATGLDSSAGACAVCHWANVQAPAVPARHAAILSQPATLLHLMNLTICCRASSPLPPHRMIASQYYVSFRTISSFNEHLKPTMGEIELLRWVACRLLHPRAGCLACTGSRQAAVPGASNLIALGC